VVEDTGPKPAPAPDAAAIAPVDDAPPTPWDADGIDPTWAKTLDPVTATGTPKTLAAAQVPVGLGARLDARVPELIGTCMTADTEAPQWFAAKGAHLYAAGVCWEGIDKRLAMFAIDGDRIAPIGRFELETDQLGTVHIEEAPGFACVGGDAPPAAPGDDAAADEAKPWHACFAVDDKALAARATTGTIAKQLAACPDTLTAIAACQKDAAFIQAIADGSPVGAAPADVAKGIAEWSKKPAETCASWIEQSESYQARSWTNPIDDFAALGAAAPKGCAALAAAIVDAGGLPYPTGE
jgi:hypothetical protein